MPELYLASRSPRRAELLRTLGVDFAVIDVEIDETVHEGEKPMDYVGRLARSKAQAGRDKVGLGNVILAADTSVIVDDEVIGKPRHFEDARQILSRLSGRWHSVLTGVALATPSTLEVICAVTRVSMRQLTAREITQYWLSGEPADKAGAYGIQGLGGALIERIDGSYSNVVGLPLAETLSLLNRVGIQHRLSGE